MESRLIPAKTLCVHYEIEISFVDALNTMGLIEIEIIEHDLFIHEDRIGELEKIIRLHKELDLTIEAIDVVLNLLEKEEQLRNEVNYLKNRLRLYEED